MHHRFLLANKGALLPSLQTKSNKKPNIMGHLGLPLSHLGFDQMLVKVNVTDHGWTGANNNKY